jgi:hypothetical protein
MCRSNISANRPMRFHISGTIGGNRDHRHFGGAIAAGRAGGSRSRSPQPMRQSAKADRARLFAARIHTQALSNGRMGLPLVGRSGSRIRQEATRWLGVQRVAVCGRGLVETSPEKKQLIMQRCQSLIGLFNCPSRRPAQLYPFIWTIYPYNAKLPLGKVTKCDYAANVGDFAIAGETNPGPSSGVAGDLDPPQYNWTKGFTGITFQRSEIKPSAITDGTSHTYMVGERYLNPDHYLDGNRDDDDGLFVGFDNDTCRIAFLAPIQDTPGLEIRVFGSAHPGGWHVAMCDGSVQMISYDLDVVAHRRMGNRSDGEIVTEK